MSGRHRPPAQPYPSHSPKGVYCFVLPAFPSSFLSPNLFAGSACFLSGKTDRNLWLAHTRSCTPIWSVESAHPGSTQPFEAEGFWNLHPKSSGQWSDTWGPHDAEKGSMRPEGALRNLASDPLCVPSWRLFATDTLYTRAGTDKGKRRAMALQQYIDSGY